MLAPNIYVLPLSFGEMVPSFLSGGGVENGHNLLNFGEQGSQTRQAIYVVIAKGKPSKDTGSPADGATAGMTSSAASGRVSFLYLHFRTVGGLLLQVSARNFSL